MCEGGEGWFFGTGYYVSWVSWSEDGLDIL